MRPEHRPEFRDALPPASEARFDGRATGAITRQLRRLRADVGDVNEAQIPNQEAEERLYGYQFPLSSGRNVELRIDTNAHGEIVGADREFVNARNRYAVLRSRERSRGSRRFNYAFMRNRGNGPGGHGYQLARAKREYDQQMSSFVARKIDGLGLGNADLVREAVGRAVIQEQKQMTALESMAAEQKSSTRALNFFRNHKKLRLAAGVALSVIGTVGIATGQPEIAIPAFFARTALGATGGYLLGRTIWDAVQGSRARRLPEDDIRNVGIDNGDFSGDLAPRAGFQRMMRLQGAEARAGSHDARRAEFAEVLGRGLVHEYFTGELNFTAGHAAPHIQNQVRRLHRRVINPVELLRLQSDQTQSRARHIAGIVGGVIVGALPAFRAIGLIGGFDIGAHGYNEALEHHGGHGGAYGTSGAGKSAGAAAHGHGPVAARTITTYNGRTINVYGNNDTIIVDNPHDVTTATHHGATTTPHQASGAHHARAGAAGAAGTEGARALVDDHVDTNDLHVRSGGGFISTMENQYHLTAAQSDQTYLAMYNQLHNAGGTYLVGSDIRISAPGDFRLPAAASTILRHELVDFHKLGAFLAHQEQMHRMMLEQATAATS